MKQQLLTVIRTEQARRDSQIVKLAQMIRTDPVLAADFERLQEIIE